MKILIVEDEIDLLTSLTAFSEKEGYNTDIANNCAEAIERISLYTYDCILLDISLPDGNGLDLLAQLKKINKTDGVFLATGLDSIFEFTPTVTEAPTRMQGGKA